MTRRLTAVSAIAFVLLAYFMIGVFTLESGEHAVILRFGKAARETSRPGMHYCLPVPIEKALKVQVGKIQTLSFQSSRQAETEFFTGDENLLVVQAQVSFDIGNLNHYLFSTADAEGIIRTVGIMTLSRELGKMAVDDAMARGNSLLRLTIKEKMQSFLNDSAVGVNIISVELTDIKAPGEVASAFESVSTARVKKQEIIKKAEGYANSTIPNARGQAVAILSEARAASSEQIHRARADAQAFTALLAEYNRNPEIVKTQQYKAALQSIHKMTQYSEIRR